jgi:hypothetical protein
MSDGNCVICAKEKLQKRSRAKREAAGLPPWGRLEEAKQRALAAGEKTFWIDDPCIHGHVAPRRVENGGCCECIRLKNLAFSRSPEGKEYFKRQATEWAQNNREARRRHIATYEAKDPERHAARKRKDALNYYYQHKDRLKDDPAHVARKRRARRKWAETNQRTPPANGNTAAPTPRRAALIPTRAVPGF